MTRRKPMLDLAAAAVVSLPLGMTVQGAADLGELPADAVVRQRGYLKLAEVSPLDQFGGAVAFDGGTAVVGAELEDGGGTNSGVARVFVRQDGGWVPQATLRASNAEAADQFGAAVAISGDTIVVGAPREDGSIPGVQGEGLPGLAEDEDGLTSSGAAYVFVRSGETWTQQAYLKPVEPDGEGFFGNSVAVDGDLVVVGARRTDLMLGDGGAGEMLVEPGAAYVFARDAGTWTQEARLHPADLDAQEDFGRSVAISGERVVVGAPLEDGGSSGVNGDSADDSRTQAGAAWVFARDGGAWSQEAYLKASNPEALDQFGHAVAIDADTILVGARYESGAATGVDGNQGNGIELSGAAYVFVRQDGEGWSQQAYLKATNTGEGDEFGTSVALSGDLAVVGAWLENGGAVGIDGDGSDDSTLWAGAAYAYRRDAGAWTPISYLKASNSGPTDVFGTAVAAGEDLVLVGAKREASSATDVDGDQSNDDVSRAGAAYAFVVTDCPADLDDSGVVGVGDLVRLLDDWGRLESDVDGDAVAGFGDLVELIDAWGPCG